MSHDKNQFEEYFVLYILKREFPEEFNDLVKRERPDLQSASGIYGVEVTSCDLQKERQETSEINNYSKKIDIDKKKSEERFEKNGTQIIKEQIDEKTICIFSNGGGLNVGLYFDNFCKQINNKIAKSKDYKEQVQKLSLAIVYRELVSQEIIENIPNWLREIYDISIFEIVYVIYNNCLGIFDTNTKKWVEKKISKSDLNNIKECAMNSAKFDKTTKN